MHCVRRCRTKSKSVPDSCATACANEMPAGTPAGAGETFVDCEASQHQIRQPGPRHLAGAREEEPVDHVDLRIDGVHDERGQSSSNHAGPERKHDVTD